VEGAAVGANEIAAAGQGVLGGDPGPPGIATVRGRPEKHLQVHHVVDDHGEARVGDQPQDRMLPTAGL
jgi:hypothetical protein